MTFAREPAPDSSLDVNSAGKPKVFLAAPYSQWMDWETNELSPVWRGRIDRLRRNLILSGVAVFNAHYNESWGKGWLPPDVCTKLDFSAMTAADAVCAVLGRPLSGGVAVELGWASALGKPIVAIVAEDAQYSHMILGLHTLVSADLFQEDVTWSDDFLDSVVGRVCSMVATNGRPAASSPSRIEGHTLPSGFVEALDD